MRLVQAVAALACLAPGVASSQSGMERASEVYAVKPTILTMSKLLVGSGMLGRKAMVVVACTPRSERGRAITDDLRRSVAMALAREAIVREVTDLATPEAEPGCPDETALSGIIQQRDVQYLVLVELREDEPEDGEIPVTVDLVDTDGRVARSYEPEGLVLVGPPSSARIQKASTDLKFFRRTWYKDQRVVSDSIFKEPDPFGYIWGHYEAVVRDENSHILEPEEVMDAPGMEAVQGQGQAMERATLVNQILNVGRWGSCVVGPLVGGCGGVMGGMGLALVGLAAGGAGLAMPLLVVSLGGGLVAGCALGCMGLCGLSGVHALTEFILSFVHGSFVRNAVSTHNKGVALEVGLEPSDVDERFFP